MITKTPAGKYRLDYRDDRGRRYRKTFDRKKDAEAEEHRVDGDISEGVYVAERELPRFEELAREWLASKHAHRPSSREQWRSHLELHLLPKIGYVRIDRLRVAAFERVRDDLLRRPAPGRSTPLSPRSVNKVMTTATAVLKVALRRRLLKFNPAAEAERAHVGQGELPTEGHAIRGPNEHVRPEEILSPTEIRRLIEHATEGFYRTLLLTAALTGCRHDELLALQWGDIDWHEGTIYVRRSLSWARVQGEETRARFFEPKTEAGRRKIPVEPDLLAALRRWRLACPASELDLVFPTPAGAPQHRSNVLRYGLYPALRRAGLRRVNMHSLRHSFASALIGGGASVAEVQALLGHANPAITLRTYTHFFPKHHSTALAGLSRAVMGSSTAGVASTQG
jgi:integrase